MLELFLHRRRIGFGIRKKRLQGSHPAFVSGFYVIVPLHRTDAESGEAGSAHPIKHAAIGGIDKHKIGLLSHERFEVKVCALNEVRISVKHLWVKFAQKSGFRR